MTQSEKRAVQQHSIRIASGFHGEQKVRFNFLNASDCYRVSMLRNTNNLLQIHAHMNKTLPQTPFEDFAVCITHHSSVLVLPIFKTLSTRKHKLSVHQQSSRAQMEVQPSWHCSLHCPLSHFPLTQTSRALLGLALTWPQAGHSIGSRASSCPCSPQSPAMLPPNPSAARSKAQAQGTIDSKAHSLALSWNAETNAPKRGC